MKRVRIIEWEIEPLDDRHPRQWQAVSYERSFDEFEKDVFMKVDRVAWEMGRR